MSVPVELSVVLVPDHAEAPDLVARWADILTDVDRSDIDRLRDGRDRAVLATARAHLRSTLASSLGCAATAIEIVRGESGKPEIRSASIRFNMSHTRGAVLVGVARDHEIGVDIERVVPTWVPEETLASSVFTPRERALWLDQRREGRRERFFELWTLKEAYLKALGCGLSYDLQRFGFNAPGAPGGISIESVGDDPSRWQFHSFTPGPLHKAGAALRIERGERPQWMLREIALDDIGASGPGAPIHQAPTVVVREQPHATDLPEVGQLNR